MAKSPQVFAFTAPGTFTTRPALFQQVLKQQPSAWVAVLPQDYGKPAGVYPFQDRGEAVRFATRQMDEGSTCFCFFGVYIPLTMSLFPGDVGEDPASAPITELIGGRLLDEEMMAGCRRIFQAQQDAALAALEAPVGESEPGLSESGTIVELEPGDAEPADAAAVSPAAPRGLAALFADVDVSDVDEEEVADDDFPDLENL